MSPRGVSTGQTQVTVYATFCVSGLFALALAAGVGLGGHLGVVVAFVVMGVVSVGLLLLYGSYVTTRQDGSEPSVGPKGDGH